MKDRRPTLNRATQKSRLLIHKVLEPNTMESIGRSLAIYMEKLISVSGLNKGILMETTIGMQACDAGRFLCALCGLYYSRPGWGKKGKEEKKIAAIQRAWLYLERQTKWESGPWVRGSANRWEWGEPERGEKQDGRVGTSHLGWIRKVIRRAQESVSGSGRSPFPKNSRLVCQQGVQMRTIRGGLWGAGASSTSAA